AARCPSVPAVARRGTPTALYRPHQHPTVGVTMSKTIGLALAAFGFAAGCAHSTTPPPSPPQAEYRIGKEDVVAVEVWKDPALSTKTPVRPDGKISLPMIGDITAEGRTAKEL